VRIRANRAGRGRRAARGALALVVLVLDAASVGAEPVELDIRAVLSFEGDLAPLSTIAARGVATGDVISGTGTGMAHLSSLRLPADLLAGTFSTTFGLPTLPFTGVALTLGSGSGTATFARSGGALRGDLPLPGIMRLCMVADCDFIAFPLTTAGGTTTLLGADALYDSTFGLFGSNALQIGSWSTGIVAATVNGVPITTLSVTTNGTRAVPVAATGLAHGPQSMTSSTALAGGVLQLVTPLAVRGDVFGTPYEIPLFGRLEIQIPEPGAPLALTACAVLLLVLERLRRRR
jgi:hypothetical protein